MKTRFKIALLVAAFMVIAMPIYLLAVLNGYSPYDEGIVLYLYSDHSLKSEKYPAYNIAMRISFCTVNFWASSSLDHPIFV